MNNLPETDIFGEPIRFSWRRFGGYECSSRGDRRFSAFYARLSDGLSIEEHYQCGIKGYPDMKSGKGKPPLKAYSRDELWQAYLSLWKRWAADHPAEIEELRKKAQEWGYILSDRFATSDINQARALACILNGS